MFAISWPRILGFVAFYSYGYFAALPLPGFLNDGLLTLVLSALVAVFFMFPKNVDANTDTIRVKLQDLFLTLGFIVLLAILSKDFIFNALVHDELGYAQYARVHAFKALRVFAQKTGLLYDAVFSKSLWISNGLLTLIAIGCYFKWRKFSHQAQWIFIFVLTLLLRTAVHQFEPVLDIHPQFKFFPLWIGSTIFGSSDLAFRVPSLFSLALLGVFLARSMKEKLGQTLSIATAFAIISIPVTVYTSTLAEPSVWCAIAWTAVLFLLPQALDEVHAEKRRLLWFRMACILGIGTMLRQPTFVGFIPLFTAIVIKERAELFKCWRVLLPFALMLPQTLAAMILKTPAIQRSSSVSMIKDAIFDGTVLNIITNNIFIYGAVLIIISMVLAVNRSRILGLIVTQWFLIGVLIFFKIAPDHWGTGRYQAEYLAPFAAFGVYLCVMQIRKFGFILAIGIITINSWYCMSLLKINKTVDERKGLLSRENKILSELPYDLQGAYSIIDRYGLRGKAFMTDFNTGNFPALMHGYRIGEWLQEFAIMNSVRKFHRDRGSTDLMSLHSSDILTIPEIRAVIVTSIILEEGYEGFSASLSRGGFNQIEEVKDTLNGSTIRIFIRPK